MPLVPFSNSHVGYLTVRRALYAPDPALSTGAGLSRKRAPLPLLTEIFSDAFVSRRGCDVARFIQL
jgi:hypothetical protein